MTDELKTKLEQAAAFIVETSARETISGNFFIYPDDVPADIISADLYGKYLGEIAGFVREYDAIAEVDISSNGAIDIIVYLDYCPNFVPSADEWDKYPDERKILDPLTTRRVKADVELLAVSQEETTLFYSTLKPARDIETGCIGHLRADFGNDGSAFFSAWDDHCPDLKTQAFKEEFCAIINNLRDNSFLKDRRTMSSYCNNQHPEAKLKDGRANNYGFKIKTDSYVYYLRCNATRGDYNLYCYAYERDKLEKCYPALAPSKSTLMERLDESKRKVAQDTQKSATIKRKPDKEV